MLDRLMGTETEYAIRFQIPDDVSHPGNDALFHRIADAVSELVHTRNADSELGGHRYFTENGGTFVFEQGMPGQGGLFEAGTPECRGPAQVLLYQRAQDALLGEAVAVAQARMQQEGLPGEIGLLKNCRDAMGNVYGAQESYEVPIAKGPRLLAWRLALALACPLGVLSSLASFAWILAFVCVVVSAIIGLALVFVAAGRSGEPDWERFIQRTTVNTLVGPILLFFQPPLFVVALAAQAFAYRPYRRHAMGFFVSRCILSGAGSRCDDGEWALSEKMADLRRIMRLTVAPSDRGLFEIGHLMKPVQALALLQWRTYTDAFRHRQRLQLGMSDANRCDVAEYLKLGTTTLLLDMVEAGVLDDAPRPRRPVHAARSLSADPALKTSVPLQGGGSMTALELQRFYADRASAWIEEVAAPMEAHRLVKLWHETLDALQRDPDELIGQLDWVTKRALVSQAATADAETDKVIDLRYHELGDAGYFTWLDDAGLTLRLVEPAAATDAIRTPPADTPARQRGELVRALSSSTQPARIGWTRIHIGNALRGRVIELDAHRDRPSKT